MSDEAQKLRMQLAERLSAAGHLRTAAWRRAVEEVPRHEFLRGGFFERIDAPGRPTAWTPVMPDNPRWLSACYTDHSLVTQIAGTIEPGDLRGEIARLPTSSGTLPSLVVRMLEDLLVENTHRLLIVGAGTGYSSGLACRRFGSDHVTAVEIDPDIASRARGALGRCGYTPTVAVGDGLAGWKDGGPYDRIVAYCGTVTLPYAWVEQTRPGGVILSTVGGWMYSSELARLTVTADGTATGRLLDGRNSFMLARPQTPPPIGLLPDIDRADDQPTELAAHVLEDWDTRFVAQLAAPRTQRMTLEREGKTEHVLVDVEAGAWAVLRQDGSRWLVRQGGPDNLWDRITDHVTRWHYDGSPTLDRFNIVVTPERQTISWQR
ncbi:ATP-grasp peptide maturase system methyltransferase [Streptomyces sp. NRRL F-4428]|uniref:ATP-grasp peptide maturase system methyltransferase n=1 Tax=Streptomyces sp. NRRL F-4428 TaxID=1609137 RepID=UPI0005EBFAE5|nr:ATP-grasp peptide maturase system methyltransferase [Streptomyces sp. NRRL F-4428]KJK50082.1 protein-L-isoaspartate(D-aspartate) O-methyltransferase [Streptomyces sp. NRRL F-4428]